MLPTTDVIRADFDRIASHSLATDRLERAALRLLARIPPRARVLEIGCGTGAFARALAIQRDSRVTAIDLAPRMIEVARERTETRLGVEYRVGDVMDLTLGGFDVAVAINTLHHLPLAEAAERMADAVVAGGLLLVADLFDARGLLELPYNALSWLVRTPHTKDPVLAAAWHEHGQHEQQLPLRVIRAVLGGALPGIVIRRHLRWRYTAMWRKPSGAATSSSGR